jgi:gamma-glutamyltranspeptidase/glutathione hydrolase
VFTTRPELVGTRGMVASTHWLASAAGMAVLEDGGNAFDAAAAAGFVLQVVEPHLNGPAGEFPALFAVAGDPRPRVLCAQGTAPAAATIERLRDSLGLRIIPGNGLLPACVPGAWPGWLTLLRDHGTKPLRDVLSPAIAYAVGGFPLVDRIPATISAVAELFIGHWPTSAAQWLPGGRAPVAGTRFRLPAVAATFERLVAEAEAAGGSRENQLDAGIRAWSEGFVAEEIDSFCRNEFRDESGRDHAGLLTADDVAAWRPGYEDAVTADVGGGWTVAKCGPWTQGPVLLQQLQLLSGFELSYVDGACSWGNNPGNTVPSAGTVHLAVECAKLAFADREAWYGDTPDVPLAELLDPFYADERRALVDPLVASHELRPGSPGGRAPRLPLLVTAGGDGDASRRVLDVAMGTGSAAIWTGDRAGDTVHVDAVDSAGNLVSVTPSGGWLQSSPTIPALGFCLGTRGQMFWLEEGLPNSLAPGKRPRITLTPSLALRDGDPVLAFGTPGGDQQDQWQLCFWLAHRAGLNLQAAIDAPVWHSTSFPSSFAPRGWEPGGLVAESRLGSVTFDELRRRGHAIRDAGPWELGRLSAVARDPASGLLYGAANPRGAQGYAVGR